MIKKGSILLMALLSVSLLVSCSRGPVKTVDKSVEYESARSLPPLKHPDHSNDVAEQVEQAQPTVITLENEPITETINLLESNIIQDKQGLPLLLIESEFEQAWNYIDTQMRNKNITVYNRNKEAGVFSIGCSDIPDVPAFEGKSGGWTIFSRRKKTTVTEYCALHVTPARKKTTSAAVMNRYGQVVGGDYVGNLFESIVDN